MTFTLRIDPPDDLGEFRAAARRLVAAGTEPGAVIWTDDEPGLFNSPAANSTLKKRRPTAASTGSAEISPRHALPGADAAPAGDTSFTVPASFVALARVVACHRDARRWSALYQAVWRIAHGERALMENEADPLVHELRRMEKSVRRDRHQMTAFVRFRSVPKETGERFIAWYEPRHRVLRLAADFFIDRFAAMQFSILTPDLTLCWDGRSMRFAAGLSRTDAQSGDAVEAWWQRYYAAIFNPARLNARLMQSHMPVQFWRNLPEARLIAGLISEASGRTQRMIDRAP